MYEILGLWHFVAVTAATTWLPKRAGQPDPVSGGFESVPNVMRLRSFHTSESSGRDHCWEAMSPVFPVR